MKIKRRIICVVAILSMIAGILPANTAMAQTLDGSDSKQVITDMVEAVQEKDWSAFTNLMCSSEQEYYNSYFADDSYTNGIKQVENVSLIDIYEVDSSLAKTELLEQEYPILSESNNIQTYIVALDCDTNVENQYFFDGINYFLIALAEENNEMKIVQFNRPSSTILDDVVVPTLSSNDGNYENEIAGINVIEQAENGLVINAEEEVLTDGFEIKSLTGILSEGAEENGEYGINPAASGTTDFPNLNTYSNYSYPSSISVKLNQTGNSKVVSVNFETYIKNTLPNEWYASWNANSLRAGAYCVKMVGWYRKIKPVSSSGGYDVTQGTQKYVPDTAATETDNAVDYIIGNGMADSTKKLFYPEYAAGTKGSAGTQSGGQLKQWGSQYLASDKGYTYKQILNYYYEGSSYSSGSLVFFSYE